MIQDRRAGFAFDGELLVTDGGLETTLIFHDGIDLPHFAAFPLLDNEQGRAALRRDHNAYAAAAQRTGAGSSSIPRPSAPARTGGPKSVIRSRSFPA